MKIESAAIRSHSGLTTLGGFAAGALTVGMIAFVAQPMPKTENGSRIPTLTSFAQGAARDAAMREIMATQAPDPSAAGPAGPWAFEVATPEPPRGPGKKRPDLMGAPEGWTYDPGRQTD
jgi:hypothetical protein